MFKHPLFTKLAALAAIIVLLLFGLGLVEDVVRDRQRYRSLTAQSVADSLAGPQTLMGPMIHSACVESWDEDVGKGDERRTVEKRREFLLTAMPEQLQLRSGAAMEERARGVHKVNTFNLKAHITAQWGPLASLQPQSTVKNSRMHYGAPIVMMAWVMRAASAPRSSRWASRRCRSSPARFTPPTAAACMPRCPRPCAARPMA